jgi:ketosteroid isomerase-like protein
MSQENVELIRRGYEVFNSGDFDAWLGLLSPDIEIDERYLAPDAAVYRGHEGVRRWVQVGSDAIGSPHFEVLRWFEGGDAVVTEVVAHVRGVGSGIEATARLAHAHRIRDQRLVYTASFPTLEQALEAVGLSEQDAHADS